VEEGAVKPHEETRVLVVDDEAAVRISLRGYLEDMEYRVSAVASSEEALALLAEASFDVGLIDLRLPGLNGEALALRIHEQAPSMRFLIYTGSAEYEVSEALKAIGVRRERVILKPVSDLSVLVRCIELLLDA
jgi:two-component system, OmpR family, response regulator